jgi:hypothetical protein
MYGRGFCVVLFCINRRIEMVRSPIQGVLPKCLNGLIASEVISFQNASEVRIYETYEQASLLHPFLCPHIFPRTLLSKVCTSNLRSCLSISSMFQITTYLHKQKDITFSCQYNVLRPPTNPLTYFDDFGTSNSLRDVSYFDYCGMLPDES